MKTRHACLSLWVLVATLALSSGVRAGPLPPIAFLSLGYREASKTMLSGTSNYALRAVDPSGFLAASADFSGDGQVDEARILVNSIRRTMIIVVVVQSLDVVNTFAIGNDRSMSSLPDLGIRVAPPRNYVVRCSCATGKQTVTLRSAGLVVVNFKGPSELLRLKWGHDHSNTRS